MCFTPEDVTEPNNHTVQGHTNICVIRQQGNNFKCSRGNDTVNLGEPLGLLIFETRSKRGFTKLPLGAACLHAGK